MPSLLVVGNTNQYTFGNAILAADQMALVAYGEPLSKILVLHSPESHRSLVQNNDWASEIQKRGIGRGLFTEHVIDMEERREVEMAAGHIERSFRATGPVEDPVYVDLTNGSSLYKNIYSTLAYLLGAQHPFVLIPGRISTESEDSGNLKGRFWTEDEIREAYFELPSPTWLDRLGPSWLTEIRRFRRRIEAEGDRLQSYFGSQVFDEDHFRREVRHAVEAWMDGERTGDSATLRGSVRSIGSAFEELLRAVQRRVGIASEGGHPSLAQGIRDVHTFLESVAPGHKPQLLHDISGLLKELRNTSVHEVTPTNLERIRARLATELLLSAVDYVAVLADEGALERRAENGEKTAMSPVEVGSEGQPGVEYYFGLDGDDTGHKLESLFLEDAEAEQFKRMSEPVDQAIRAIAKRVGEPPIRGKVLFASGDDILFRGRYSRQTLDALRETYRDLSKGLTCSIGFGDSPKAAYVALKIAKARPGKDSIQGVILKGRESEE
jgi:hypothetical protein